MIDYYYYHHYIGVYVCVWRATECINFAGSPVPYAKHRINAIDTENLTTKFTLIEGGWLGDKLKSIDYEVKFEESGDGGCVIKLTGEYHTKVDGVVFKQEDVKEGEDQAKGFYAIAGDYLLVNPHVCA